MPLTRFLPGRSILAPRPASARPTGGGAPVSIIAVESDPSTSQTVHLSERGAFLSTDGGFTVIVRVGSAHYRCRLRRAFEATGGRTAYGLDVEEPCDVSPPFAGTPAPPLDESSFHASLMDSLERAPA